MNDWIFEILTIGFAVFIAFALVMAIRERMGK